ncbi:lantibiotic dehydratase [Streptosporangium sp. NPDC020072]|uniref:lantibiotic dehydratase n=1 Tax=Streptosporangium sp. NPDC020072 TaxID=3154788 RepID=UPI00342EB268
MSPRRRSWFEPVGAAMFRAATAPSDLAPGFWPSLDRADEEGRWRLWLVEVWSLPDVARAVAIASPVLAGRIAGVVQGDRPGAADIRKMVVSLARYLVRMRGRATPFGIFAGVGLLRFGKTPSVRPGPGRSFIRARADSMWLSLVIAALEGDAELRQRLPVVANDLLVVRGDRVVVPWQPHSGDLKRSASTEVSVRHTSVVRTVLGEAASPIIVKDLIGKVSATVPDVPVEDIDAMIDRLIFGGLLISSLRPPSTCVDRLDHVLTRLREAGAGTIPSVAHLVAELAEIHTLMEHDRDGASVRMRGIATPVAGQPLMVDLRIDQEMVLPSQVAEEAAAAVGALVRLSPHPAGHPGWRAYHSAFLSRYYANALVPVTQLTDPIQGLGFPEHFTEPPGDLPAALSLRDTRLLALAQQAALDGVREVRIDDAFIDSFHPDGTDRLRTVPHLELCAEVLAPSLAALAHGEFRLSVSGMGRTGFALSGRFLDLLAGGDRDERIEQSRRLPVGVEGAISAQLSFPPRHPHLENVARSPQLLPHLITLAEHKTGDEFRFLLSDLAVTANSQGMYLISRSKRVVVEPVLAHAASRDTMPPIVRFLFEVPRALFSGMSPFAWGAARCLPFLPRVVYRRTVLSPARWRIPVDALPTLGISGNRWHRDLTMLRDRLGLPDVVSVGESDLRLRLRLDEPMDRAVLREYLAKARTGPDPVLVSEASTAVDHGWFGGRANEIIVPLASTSPPVPPPVIIDRKQPLRVVLPDQAIPSEPEVVFAQLHGDPRVFDTILTNHLPGLLALWERPPMWWFVRYRDPVPHLRLRLHVGSQEYGEAVAHVSTWAADMRRRRLIGELTFSTYRPETVRYGTGQSLKAAEALFAADSSVVLTQLVLLSRNPSLNPRALTAASLVNFACSLAGNPPAGMRWLIDHANIGPAPAAKREAVRQAVLLSEPTRSLPLPLNGGQDLASAWTARSEAAAHYVRLLGDDGVVASPFGSLLHMNHIRTHGIDPECEQACHRLARSVALAWSSQRASTGGVGR